MTTLKDQITDVLKATMRAKEMSKLTVIRVVYRQQLSKSKSMSAKNLTTLRFSCGH